MTLAGGEGGSRMRFFIVIPRRRILNGRESVNPNLHNNVFEIPFSDCREDETRFGAYIIMYLCMRSWPPLSDTAKGGPLATANVRRITLVFREAADAR